MADENNKVVDIEGLSHFKAKQDLYNAEKFQSKGSTDLTGAVLYNAVQVLTEEQKAQARANIGAGTGDGSGGSAEGAVLYNAAQALTDEQKTQARENIGTTDGTWESMPDKPFGEGGKTVIEMPSDTSGSMIISSQLLEDLGGPGVDIAFSFVKVGNKLNSADEIHGAEVSVTANGSAIDFVVNSSHITDVGNGFVILYTEGTFLPACLNITSAGAATIPTQDMLGEDLIINATEEGFYFLYVDGMAQTNSVSKSEIKKIDKKFLPDDITPDLPEGIVTTDENGLIPASMLPSYVDDVVEAYRFSDTLFYKTFYEDDSGTHYDNAISPESGKIYVDLHTGNTYRWSGSVYVRMNPDEYTIATTSDIDALFT